MATVIKLESRRRASCKVLAVPPEGATILLYTGVRIERLEGYEEPARQGQAATASSLFDRAV